LSPDEFTSEQQELVGDWATLNFSKVVINHPAMYRVFVPYIAAVIAGSSLPPRDREVLVVRTLGLGGDTYEMHHHVQIAHKAGMPASEVEAMARGEVGDPWEQLLIKAADELVQGHELTRPTWAALSERYSREQVMEVVFLVGCYSTMAMLTRSFDMEVEDDPETEAKLRELREYT